MLAKTPTYTYVPGTPGQVGQAHSVSCPPPPPPPHGGGGGGNDSGGGGCQPGTGNCCTIVMLPNQYGILVPTVVCV